MTKVRVLWDRDNDGWFCRITLADGREIDSLPPEGSMYNVIDMFDEDLYELARRSVMWECGSDEKYDVVIERGTQ